MGIKVVFFDCDGTLTKVKSSWEYIHRHLNIWENNADEYQRLFRQGHIGYDEFCRRDALLWKGLAVHEVMDIVNRIPYQEGSREAVDALRGAGIFTVILSTGLSFLVDRVREDLGINMSLSNDLLVTGGFLTGETVINVGYDQKGFWADKILRSMSVSRTEACAIGDGEGDKGMFEAVGLSIGFCPHPSMEPFLTHTIRGGPLVGVVDIIKGHT